MFEVLLPLIPMVVFALFPTKGEMAKWKKARASKKEARAAVRMVARSGAIRY